MLVEHAYFPRSDLEFIVFSALDGAADAIYDKLKGYIPVSLGLGDEFMEVLVGYLAMRYMTNKWIKMLGTVLAVDGIGKITSGFISGALGKIGGG